LWILSKWFKVVFLVLRLFFSKLRYVCEDHVLFLRSLGQAALDISAFILVKANEEVEERAKRVASAARRWKEYLRRVVDKPPTFKLPEASLSKDK